MNAINPLKRTRWQTILLVAGIVLISINLRPGLAAIGPLVGSIRVDTGLSNAMLGLLTTLPLLAFGVVSMLTPLFTRRYGMEVTLAGAMVLLTAGTLLRVIPWHVALFGGTLLLGIAIAFGNVLLPSLIKRDFPHHTGIMTSIYSGVLGLGATLAAGISVPLAQAFGWRWSIAAWALPAVAAFLIWIPQLRHKTHPRHKRNLPQSLKHLGSNTLAWQVALFMGFQSLTFYVVLAWLPEILQSRGLSPSYAGWMLSLSQGMGIFGSLLMPVWAERLRHQRGLIMLIVALEGISLGGLILPSTLLVPLWVSVLGLSLGGSFGLALLFIVLRTKDTETATELSGIAQSVGYSLAATGPALFGLLHDFSHNWTLPLIGLLVILLMKFIAGLGAGRAIQID